MKTLYLMRHAKSSRDMFGISDIERPLLMEGIEDTQRIGMHLKSLKIGIRHIVSSPAKRAMKTATTIAAGFGIKRDEILVYNDLYKPDIPAFEDCIFSLPNDWDHVLLVSHNPGISDFAQSLLNGLESMPAGSLLVIACDTDSWINLYAAPRQLKFFLLPDQLNA